MIDTVTMRTTVKGVDVERLQLVPGVKLNATPLKPNRLTYYYQIDGNPLKFSYRPAFNQLRVEVSIPGYLFGNNATPLTPQHLPQFYFLLSEELTHCLGIIPPPIPSWELIKADFKRDFLVGDRVGDYLFALSKVIVPGLKTTPTGQGRIETVYWKSKSKSGTRIKCYDKYQQCLDCHLPTDEAAGKLRFETTISTQEFKFDFNKTDVGSLLCQDVAKFYLERDLKRIGLDKPLILSSTTQVRSKLDSLYKPNQVEKLLGFIHMYQELGPDKYRKWLGNSNFYDRRKMLEAAGIRLNELGPIELPALSIEPKCNNRPKLQWSSTALSTFLKDKVSPYVGRALMVPPTLSLAETDWLSLTEG